MMREILLAKEFFDRCNQPSRVFQLEQHKTKGNCEGTYMRSDNTIFPVEEQRVRARIIQLGNVLSPHRR